ncbi:hypothetical protein [Tissierella creatinophila]|uniref:Uncharacterized protein n=1 Tax=Tissierella creatinophila DSM 6911 TaxID=1123403 RepID=A0A1U7M6G5_TISCR|nr:hypothetical protein [Tissierella creatinophila]OLS02912.1 hypothetical protein TICRE_10660 [Tissierella creatinophila DSM 6911]
MKSTLKTITVDRCSNKTIREGIKEVDLNHDPWEELCKVLAEAFIESRKGGKVNV